MEQSGVLGLKAAASTHRQLAEYTMYSLTSSSSFVLQVCSTHCSAPFHSVHGIVTIFHCIPTEVYMLACVYRVKGQEQSGLIHNEVLHDVTEIQTGVYYEIFGIF